MLKKDPPRKKNVIDLHAGANKRAYINLDDDGPGSEQLGTLVVVLLKARNLNDKHFRKQDVFAQATLNGVTKKTKVDLRAGQHPVWDQELRFSIVKSKRSRNRKLEVECYSQEPNPLPDQLLGKGVIDLTEMLKTGEFDEWIELSIDGVQRGEVYLEMTFFSNDPEPEPEPEPVPQPNSTPKNKIVTKLLEVDSMNLQRRPSKLSPAERLSRPRPAFVASPLEQHPPTLHVQPSNGQGNRIPSGPTHMHGSPVLNGRDPLPIKSSPEALEASVPPALRPGGGRSPPSTSPISIPQVVPTLYGLNRLPSPSPPTQTPFAAPQFASLPSNLNPYLGTSSPFPGHINNAQMHPPPQRVPTALWRQDGYQSPIIEPGVQNAGGFSVRLPVGAGPHIQDHIVGYNPPLQTGYNRDSRDAWPAHIRPDVDPARLARYSSPLPLPPGVVPAVSRVPSVAPTPSTDVAPPSKNPPAPVAPAEPVAPAAPSKGKQPAKDTTRVEALKRAEDEAKSRHEQEIRDLEIAMQLDRELNHS